MTISATLCVLTAAVSLASPAAAFDHSTLDRVLRKYVREGRVDYRGLKTDDEFPRYLAAIARADPDSFNSRNEQIAFWINAYNASCLAGVTRRYPLASVRDVPNFFDLREHKVAGKSRSLNDIEHDILRKRFKEPRLHFALNCASLSCPALSNHAYTGARLEAQLDAAARRFLNDPARNQFNTARRTARLSALFKWYGKDFGGRRQMLKTIARYLPARIAAMLKADNVRVSYLKYDWSLNVRSPR